MKIASLRLPDEIFQRLDRLADRTGRSKTFYMQAAIPGAFGRSRGLVPCRATADRHSSRASQTVPLEEVMERYGLEDRA